MANSRFTTFRDLVNNLHQHVPVHIPSPLEQPRRAAVVAILRWHCSRAQPSQKVPTSIQAFFDQNWVKEDKEGYAEILFMQRTARAGDRWSGHVAFVGGKNEQGESDRDTAKREVLEEIGIDLNDTSVFLPVGKLNEREISSIKDDKLLMILVPFVYLQIVPESPSFQLQASEVAAVQCKDAL
ncbi:hypothetical protein CU098_005606 [Rhizopus stolonifer]|uniref:Nudix hydrolase domain-containing protein n=1 Tax=Rhizopus stolonifer TaxID=4846 RepID=A0A367JGU0_RHIST|nr:hypothetical protein CU098_005606 [Rhizopus stolonifer]